MSCGVGHRCSLDMALLWLWCRPAAVALIGPRAWEPPNAAGAALKRKNNNSDNTIKIKEKEKRVKGDRCFSFWLLGKGWKVLLFSKMGKRKGEIGLF